jgi:hypothetical protein
MPLYELRWLIFPEVTEYNLRWVTRKLTCSSSTTPTAALMFQFVPHSLQQLRYAEGLLEGLSCSEEFRNI